MRTTLDIDDDILAAAKELAHAEGKTAGKVLSDLARRALTSPNLHPAGMHEGQQAAYDDTDDGLFPRFPKRGNVVITSEHVRQIQDEIDEDEALRAARIARGEPVD